MDHEIKINGSKGYIWVKKEIWIKRIYGSEGDLDQDKWIKSLMFRRNFLYISGLETSCNGTFSTIHKALKVIQTAKQVKETAKETADFVSISIKPQICVSSLNMQVIISYILS